jgi:uncharacterized protein with HEPN domain
MLECIEKVQTYTMGMDEVAFAKDRKTVDAVIRNIEILGEAAQHVPNYVRDKYSDIRWADIRGIRNIMAHGYFGVDLSIVWRVVRGDAIELGRQLEKLRAAENF